MGGVPNAIQCGSLAAIRVHLVTLRSAIPVAAAFRATAPLTVSRKGPPEQRVSRVPVWNATQHQMRAATIRLHRFALRVSQVRQRAPHALTMPSAPLPPSVLMDNALVVM